MKKHIIGLMLFGFIVSATAIVYAFFNVSEFAQVNEVVSVSTPQYVSSEKTHSKMRLKSRSNSIEVRQAVLNIQTKEFSWELVTPQDDLMLVLHFFLKDNEGTHYITTEQQPHITMKAGKHRFNTTSFDWLSERKSYENLYVTAEFFPEYDYTYDYQPTFDATKATAVTIDYGK